METLYLERRVSLAKKVCFERLEYVLNKQVKSGSVCVMCDDWWLMCVGWEDIDILKAVRDNGLKIVNRNIFTLYEYIYDVCTCIWASVLPVELQMPLISYPIWV